ncbi:reverse transcriptase domain-containing protein [Tanacetum coccineum]|uniref:Reverse transcriptase domain-containing protein n=1 Tax=Tanacetum coccineum TaxID=301880 RepID=A0ABQ5DEM4_9ASTR
MIKTRSRKEKKRKDQEATKAWMNTPITFPPISLEDISDEPLIKEVEVEGYLVRRVYMDKGASVEVVEDEKLEVDEERAEAKEVGMTEGILVNPAFLDQLVVIEGGLSKAFMALEKNDAVAKEVDEWVYPSIVRLIGRTLEAYVDDMVKKSNDEKALLAYVAETFDNIRRINMKLNPKKCSFGVEEGKFLGYMVTSEGIRANHKKTKALADLQSPRTLKEMQSLFWKTSGPQKTIEAEEAFQQMKRYIINLPSLIPPLPKETLYEYLAVSKEAVSSVLLTDRKGKQHPINYVSHTLNEVEKNYAPMERLALSLVPITRRIRRYLEAHPVKVITNQPIKQILNKTEASGKLAKYAIDTPEVVPERDDTKEWTLFTDGASRPKGSRAGLVLIGPSDVEYTYALRLTFSSTNNEEEYEELLACLRIARRMRIQILVAKVDSKLVASQINRNYVASSNSMIKYLAKEKEYIACIKSFSIKNISRNLNQKADVLSKLASVAFNYLTKEVLVEVLSERSTEVKEINTMVEEEGDNCMTSIIECLEKGIWPKDKNEARNLRVKINQYAMEEGVLFKKSYMVPMLRCVGPLQANYVIR